MAANIIDGKAIAASIRREAAARAAALCAKGRRPPGLGVILVGDHPASRAYVSSKTKACAEAGFHSQQVNLPADAPEATVLAQVEAFNRDPAIHGILVQLPLPKHVSEERVTNAILPEKDVDGFHPVNMGLLARGTPRFVPCTPLGVRELLLRSGIETRGRLAIVIGRSNIVGRPMELLLSAKGPGGDATVIIAHSATRDLIAISRQCDIVIAAIGRPRFVSAEMVRPGATVIDVGISRVDDPSSRSGSRLVGDVDFESVAPVAGAITPVPGGVGPMTIGMLLHNTATSAEAQA
jgi:methylenetetrahydrofolate dehydrogenase (NADP+)/methenyltetrahydrofolate cyclohydrolase